jgi:deoxyribonuclease V
MQAVESAVASGQPEFPYTPSLFTFRELPTLIEELRKIRSVPDLLICDAQGIAHSRRFGLACHVGVLYDIPAIGCAKTRLIGESSVPEQSRGSSCPIIDAGEMIGAVLRTQSAVRPVYVSVGHRISVETACHWVLRLAPAYRIPEPLCAANRLAKAALTHGAEPKDIGANITNKRK